MGQAVAIRRWGRVDFRPLTCPITLFRAAWKSKFRKIRLPWQLILPYATKSDTRRTKAPNTPISAQLFSSLRPRMVSTKCHRICLAQISRWWEEAKGGYILLVAIPASLFVAWPLTIASPVLLKLLLCVCPPKNSKRGIHIASRILARMLFIQKILRETQGVFTRLKNFLAIMFPIRNTFLILQRQAGIGRKYFSTYQISNSLVTEQSFRSKT